jgi:hypothetical protein
MLQLTSTDTDPLLPCLNSPHGTTNRVLAVNAKCATIASVHHACVGLPDPLNIAVLIFIYLRAKDPTAPWNVCAKQ